MRDGDSLFTEVSDAKSGYGWRCRLLLQARVGAQNLVQSGPLGLVDLVEGAQVNADDLRIKLLKEKIDALFERGGLGLGRESIRAAIHTVGDAEGVEPGAEHRALGFDQPRGEDVEAEDLHFGPREDLNPRGMALGLR